MGYSIYDLASFAVTKLGLKGIDWAALATQGRATVWDRDYMTSYMLPAQIAMAGVTEQLDLGDSQDIATMQKSYTLNSDIIDSIASTVGGMLGAPGAVELVEVQVNLSKEAIRYLISHASQAANYGALTHYDETIHHSGMSDADIAAHADLCVGTMNAIVLLDNLKFFSLIGLKNDSSASGLGIAPALLIAAVVVTIAVLALIAWIIVSIVDLTKKNSIVATMCQQAQASGDAATTQQCVQTLTDPTKNAGTAIPDLFAATLKSLVPYALGGVAIYALFLSAPYIIKNLLSPKSKASAA